MTLLVGQSTGNGTYQSSSNLTLEALHGPRGLTLVDGMSSAGSRHLGNTRKLHIFSAKRGHGTLMGTGSTDICLEVGSQIEEIADRIPKRAKDYARALAQEVSARLASRVAADVGAAVRGELESALAPYAAFKDADIIDKATFEDKRRSLLERLAEKPPGKSYAERHPTLMLTLYDKEKKRIRHFTMRSDSIWEAFDYSIARGSGYDGGEREMDRVNAGLTHTLRSRGMLAYEALSAYVISSFEDDGVGNDCFMAEISPEDTCMVQTTRVTAMHNLVCAFKARLNPGELTERRVVEALDTILQESEPPYDTLRTLIKYPTGNPMGADEFKLLKIPFYQFRNVVNRDITRDYGVKPRE